MKIFLDTANTEFITKWAHSGLIDGITTNPTHLSKEGGNPTETVLTICQALPLATISVEITQTEPDDVYLQARKIASLSDNIVVKIPCYPPYYPIIKKLIAEGIAVNITLLFSLTQGLMMAKLGADYISPFVGRLNDSGIDGMNIIRQLRHMLDWYGFETQLLAASIRDTQNLEHAIMAGADIATIPTNVFEESLTHQLTDKGMAQFAEDWKKLNIQQFP